MASFIVDSPPRPITRLTDFPWASWQVESVLNLCDCERQMCVCMMRSIDFNAFCFMCFVSVLVVSTFLRGISRDSPSSFTRNGYQFMIPLEMRCHCLVTTTSTPTTLGKWMTVRDCQSHKSVNGKIVKLFPRKVIKTLDTIANARMSAALLRPLTKCFFQRQFRRHSENVAGTERRYKTLRSMRLCVFLLNWIECCSCGKSFSASSFSSFAKMAIWHSERATTEREAQEKSETRKL